MAKLKCVADKKRTHVINNKVIHRDGSKCNTPKGEVEINNKSWLATSEKFTA